MSIDSQKTDVQREEVHADPTPANTLIVTFSVNGKSYSLAVDPRVTLLDALRDHLGLTGTKKGCDHGQCGACTILINGKRKLSCLTLAVAHQDDAITTIEGLARNGRLHPLQDAFIAHDAFQCGACTAGQLISALGLLSEGHSGSEEEIREWMSGNLCRCGAYANIVAAICEVAKGEGDAAV
ncbi:MAG TPA: (2Fe-2S)-binding protein [Ktedonosporobacter sp.]|nr:(2Fe-2S)-binding protein [Ktedonosporobacter sp.]